MKKFVVWLPALVIVIIASSAVGIWRSDFILGILSKFSSKPPVAANTRPAAVQEEGVRICSHSELSISPSVFSPTGRIEIDEKATILARFIVTTKNCIFPITYAWFRWNPADLYHEQFHVSLSNAVLYPYARDLKLIYRYASYDKPLCIGAPLAIFDVPLQYANYYLIPVKNITTVPPNSSQEFIMRGDLLIDRNDLAPQGMPRSEPEYSITAGVGASANPVVYLETNFAPRKFSFEGQPVRDGQIFDTCW